MIYDELELSQTWWISLPSHWTSKFISHTILCSHIPHRISTSHPRFDLNTPSPDSPEPPTSPIQHSTFALVNKRPLPPCKFTTQPLHDSIPFASIRDPLISHSKATHHPQQSTCHCYHLHGNHDTTATDNAAQALQSIDVWMTQVMSTFLRVS